MTARRGPGSTGPVPSFEPYELRLVLRSGPADQAGLARAAAGAMFDAMFDAARDGDWVLFGYLEHTLRAVAWAR